MRTGSVAERFSGLSMKDKMRVDHVMHTKLPQRFFMTLEALSKCQAPVVQKLVTDPKVIKKGLLLWGYKDSHELISMGEIDNLDLVRILATIERHCGEYTPLALSTLLPKINFEHLKGEKPRTQDLVLDYKTAGDLARKAKNKSEAEEYIRTCNPPDTRPRRGERGYERVQYAQESGAPWLDF